MVELATRIYSFPEYLNYCEKNHTDNKYELVHGELKIMPPASGFHALIINFIYDIFKVEIKKIQKSWQVIPGTVGVRTADQKSRIPDMMILSQEQCQAIRKMTSAVLETPPILVVEIVSPGNSDDDYRYKRSEYAVIEIPEYWIIDPELAKVSVLLLVNGFYEVSEFTENEEIKSSLFADLKLTPEQIFSV
jgi:Uma2 family endonuclease